MPVSAHLLSQPQGDSEKNHVLEVNYFILFTQLHADSLIFSKYASAS